MNADLILHNATVLTMDSTRPEATAIAMGAGRIIAVGDDASVLALAGPETEQRDLAGAVCLPGFIDLHFHFYDWSILREQLPLSDCRSLADLLARVLDTAEHSDEWVVGQGFIETGWPEGRLPNRHDLDGVTGGRPTVIWRGDLHLAVCNSAALERAGIHRDTEPPEHGVIDRDADGQPTGVLRELAIDLVRDVMPVPSQEQLSARFRDGIAALSKLGITGLCDIRLMGGGEGARAFRTWQQLDAAGELDLRCWVGIPGQQLDRAIELGLRSGFGSDRLRVGHVKYFADGGMGARTARMLEPYHDGDCGMPITGIDLLTKATTAAHHAGLGVMIHGIGDRANRELIAMFGELKAGPLQGIEAPPVVRHRIEHAQVMRPEDVERMGQLDIVAVVQPHNLVLDIDMIEESIGERGCYTYPFKSLLQAGVEVCLSSDAPVCDPSPLVGIAAAVTRQRPDGTPEGGWYPSQRLTVEEALYGYTMAPARAMNAEHELGSITPGKRADLVVLAEDPRSVPPLRIGDIEVVTTIFDGRVVV